MSRRDGLPDMRYIRALSLPRKDPSAGRVLVHNHVIRTPTTVSGDRGFRAWTQNKTRDVVRCRCGWAPDVTTHYRVRVTPYSPAMTQLEVDRLIAADERRAP